MGPLGEELAPFAMPDQFLGVGDCGWPVKTYSKVALTNGMYSIHFKNLSISTNTNLKLPRAGLNGPIMSRPQHANGQDDRIVWIS